MVSKGSLVVLALVVDAAEARGSTVRLRFVGGAFELGSLVCTGCFTFTFRSGFPRFVDDSVEEAAFLCEKAFAAEIGRRPFVGEDGSLPMLVAA